MPFYHLVSDEIPVYVKHLYKPKTIAQFKADLAVLLNYYKPISLQEVIAIQSGKKQLTAPSFHLSFDDGLANFYNIIAPILLEKNIPATVFLNTNFVDNKDLFYRYKASLLVEESKKKQDFLNLNYNNSYLLDEEATKLNLDFNQFLNREKPYLSLQQIKELQKKGFTFGAHSVDHPKYQDLEINQQIKQTLDSLQWIKDNLQQEFAVFSFPFYDEGISKDFFNSISKKTDLTFGTYGFHKDQIPTNLQRLDMEKTTNTKLFLLKEYLKLFFKKITNNYMIKRK